MFFQLLLIVSIVVWVVGTVGHGSLSPEGAALALVALVILAGIGRSQGWGLIGTVFRIGIPVASAITFALSMGGGDPRTTWGILGGMLTVTLVLFGIYIMVFGAFRGRRKRRRGD